jgi:TPR repeat protein
MAIDNDNSDAIYGLGNYYYNVEKNYKKAIKYFLMAIDRDNSDAIIALGVYYCNIEKNYEEMKKYYIMAINKGDSHAMCNLAIYYDVVENNYEEAKKYYLMAINNGNTDAIHLLKKIENKINNKIFFQKINENKDYEKIDKPDICLICKNEKDILINFNCDEKRDHYYCHECVNRWYEDNDLKCLLCFCEINTNSVKIVQCGDNN